MQPIRSLIVAAAVALAAPVAAQEAPAPETPAPETPAVEAPAAEAPAVEAPAAEAPTAAPAEETAAPAKGAAAPAPGTQPPGQGEVMEVIRDTFGDWQVRCAPEGDECFMYQLARDEQENPVAEVSILKLPEAEEADAGVTVVTPLGTLLPQGVVVQIDGGEQRRFPFAWCSQVGCFSRFGLARPSVDAMKRGKAGTLTLHAVAAPERPVTLALSLTGFTAAYDSLTVPTPPATPAAAPAAAAPAPAESAAPLAPAN